MGGVGGGEGAGQAKSLDLDTDARESGIRGAGEIAMSDKHERSLLLLKLFEHIRRGQLPQALQLCRDCQESWRAASLVGGTAWRPRSADGGEGNAEMDVDEEEEAGEPGTGNRNRRLWKKTCRAIAKNVSL